MLLIASPDPAVRRAGAPRRSRLAAALAACATLASSASASAAPPATPRQLAFAEALRLARENNEQLLLSIEDLKQAQLARDRAWAALLPSLSASGTFTHADREIVRDVGGQRVTFQRQDAFAGMIRGTLTLIRASALGEVLRSYRASAAAAQQQRWQQATVLFEVARAYFAALAATNLVQAAERAVQSAKQHLDAVRTRRAAGEALGVDQTRAKIELVSARGDLIRTESARDTALDLLAFLVGLQPPIALRRPTLAAAPGGSPSARRLARRPDVAAARLEVEAAQRAMTSAWLDYLPSLSVSGSYEATQNTGFSGIPDSWRVMLTLDWLLLDGGLRRATRLGRASTLRARRLQRRLLERAAAREVRQARRELRATRASLHTAGERLALARESRALVLRRYQAGLGTSLDVVEADDALRQAEVNHVGEQLELALKQLELLKAVGLDPLGAELGEQR